MKTYDLFRQYYWLVSTIYRYGRLTFKEIDSLWLDSTLSDGERLSRTTFNRHREAIANMFGIEIECNKKDQSRYYIANPDALEEDSIQRWMISTISVNTILTESKSVHDRIILEHIPSEGNNLHSFIDAMKNGRRIKVCYKRYGVDEEPKTLVVEPYFVKLFKKRWYAIVKYPEPSGWIITLAFDRFISLEITGECFEYDKDFSPAEWFKDQYGIMRDSESGVENIIIRAYGREAYYMRDLPLHHSQTIIDETSEYTDFGLMIVVSDDFLTPLLSRGAAIKVMEPKWLAEKVKEMHIMAAKLYDE